MLIAYSKALVGATLALAILNTTAFAASKTNQIQIALIMTGVCESLLYAQKAGLDHDKLIALLS